MNTRRSPRALSAALLVTFLLALMLTAPTTPVAAAETPQEQVEQVVGQGWLAKAACIGCLAAFGFAGGGTVIGVAIVAGLAPEAAAACAFGCIVAFS